MPIVDTYKLCDIALGEGIVIEHWDFPKPLDAVYFFEPGLPPTIGIANRIRYDSPLYRCILAEELGHHFTTVGNNIANSRMNYHERLSVGKVEYKAMRWATETLIPIEYLRIAILQEKHWTNWVLAEYFDVTIEMIDFRLQLPDAEELVIYTKYRRYG
ncbi:ImmA/IrrE family metallo-endopeptidase [Lysinibacillus boronitolerans]|uniref:ImmA/IrrE family metallo-endopeptidase n=1 Tax=Lysinibacillus boronitolerans TaxID=309788 RepID=UPI0006908EE3|nr:ImmA/IrrE family metallo-endopeptidase [Lysinibacillus boronitolerans]